MDDVAEQIDEIEAIQSIYDSKWKAEAVTNSYTMQISPDVKLFITLKTDYPSKSAPNFELLAPTLTVEDKRLVVDEFKRIYEDNKGSPILYQWIEKLKEIVYKGNVVTNQVDNNLCGDESLALCPVEEKVVSYRTFHCDTIQDRKSVFQGHAMAVFSLEDTKAFTSYLLEYKKVAQATHNISAYRIKTPKGVILQDCDDDGETHAGGRVLHLLQILDVMNVMVVVSRWYGGIQLGPDRFKHINNAARSVLVEGGFIK